MKIRRTMSALSPTTARLSGSIRTTPMHISIEVSTESEKETTLAPKPIWRRPNASTRTSASKPTLGPKKFAFVTELGARNCGAKPQACLQLRLLVRTPARQCLLIPASPYGQDQRVPTACEAGKLATGCFFGLRGTDEFLDVTESGGMDTEVFTELGAANFRGPCGLPPFNSRSCST